MLNSEQLRSRAQEFALTHELASTNDLAKRYWPSFRADMASLHEFSKHLKHNKVECKQPAEDWLLDHINFIEVQAQVVFKELPRNTLHRLPKLKSTGMPRIYALCEDYLEAVDGRYDVQSFEQYLLAFQDVAVLKDIESWTLLSALRVIIIKKLAAVMHEVRKRHSACHSVVSFIKKIDTSQMSDNQIRALLEKETDGNELDPIQIVHFVQHLSEVEPKIRVVHEWLVAHVGNSISSLEQMVSLEHNLQTELQVTCGNLVRSLHTIERLPWRITFSKISRIEQILQTDTSGDYERLDQESQDLMRSRVVKTASQLNVPETLVAETAIKLSSSKRKDKDKQDVTLNNQCLAYYLLNPKGVSSLRDELAKITRPRVVPHLVLKRKPSLPYFLSMCVLMVTFLILTGNWIVGSFDVGPLALLTVFIALLLPVSDWVIQIVHEVIGRTLQPTPLLRYDFSEKLPTDAKTMVVLPVIWSSTEEIDEVVDQLQIHFLSNRQENIYFGILADFCDADTETTPIDSSLVNHAMKKIDELRSEYGQERFFLFHRSRLYNAVDGQYMGWERKRGKLVEFVELLNGKKDTSYSSIHGETRILSSIRYIFTTDFDTHLPIGVVARMVGTIHYPYNRPVLNKEGTRVVEGFGLLQPRVGVSFESTQQSKFAALWGGEPGVDPYAFAVSNVYQDLFGHAIFVGKGIFDVEAFQKTLVDRIPEHSVLSHDLLEGGFLRAGLTSDIEVVESYPKTFFSHERRAHRWIRGDWQLIKWLGKTCKDRYGENKPVSLCSLTRWQIIDNLRRSLRSPILFLLAVLGYFALPGRSWVWASIVILTMFAPFIVSLISGIMGRSLSRGLGTIFIQCVVQFLTIPFNAVLSFDAIVRTLYRVFISRKNLLEWVPSAQADREDIKRRVFLFEPAGFVCILLFALVAFVFARGLDLVFAFLLVVAWLSARPVIQTLNEPQTTAERTWLVNARDDLEKLASQIWSFYDKYVTAEESWLPPDNVQYHPTEVIAHRTSPTNIGLYLVCVVSAHDLGLINTATAFNRIEATLRTVQRMEKWNGHLLNWYDTVSASPLFPRYVSTVDSGNFVAYLIVLEQSLLEWKNNENIDQLRLSEMLTDLRQLIEQTDFKALYNSNERLFSLGFHLDSGQKDTILYDLLASEARQASIVAIAMGQIPVSHWFSLGRTMTHAGKINTLLSWSGTMFEYLMPSLIMRTYPNTIWDHTYQGVVKLQREYADQFKLPFGISESGYYAFDYQLNYQYRAFGVPGLGLDRGLDQNLVLAPYATIMALPFAGNAGVNALNKFKELGVYGEYGYYEAVDFTTPRLTEGQSYQIIQSYMAHHQGMSMLTLSNLLCHDVMINRFHADARIRTTELLLQERMPKKAAILEEPIGMNEKFNAFDDYFDKLERTFTKPTSVPEVNVLSNNRLTSVCTNNGTGFISWNGLSITRWQEDPVMDRSGMMVYLHEPSSDETWNITNFSMSPMEEIQASFRIDKTTYKGTYRGISSNLEIAVAPDVDAEIRRLVLTNHSQEERLVEVTTFAELALASPSAFDAHPAFNKLFIDTSFDEAHQCILAKRRTREDEEQEVWAVHTIYSDHAIPNEYEFETDRAKFISRGNSLIKPKAMASRLKGLTGSVVDPAFIMRRRIRMQPNQSTTVYIVTGIAHSKEKVTGIVQHLREASQVDHTFQLSLVRSQIDLRHLHLTPNQAETAHILAARLLFTPPLADWRSEAIKNNVLGQSSLWSHGISGDSPLALVTIRHEADLPFVVLLGQQHQYLCKQGLEVDLVVLDETVGGYQDQLMNRLRDQLAARGLGDMRRMVVLKASQLDLSIQTLLKSVARVSLRAGGPSLRAQLRVDDRAVLASSVGPLATPRNIQSSLNPSNQTNLEFFNGWGGFADGGQTYEIFVKPNSYLPRPWSNIMANPQFGCLMTDLGTGYSWWRNSRECKLTPWMNDPVLDEPGECLYLQDVESKEVWSATPKPAGGSLSYKVTHGKGFSRFEQQDTDVVHSMEVMVPVEDTVKLMKLQLRNTSGKTKRVGITYYAEWVLGVTREAQAPYIVTEWDGTNNTLLARNAFQEMFRDAISFLHVSVPSVNDPVYSWTGNREEFIGRGGSREYPTALTEKELSRRTGTFANSCGALQTTIEIQAGQEQTVLILLGCETSKEKVAELVQKYRSKAAYDEAKTLVESHWQSILGQVQVQTPDRSMDIMMNGWLLYQTLACRLWARTAFYQAGGAFGYRDQLQDSLALLHADPTITRKQILINAAHQYEEGDVQHWWHRETHKGIRTKFSDDLLWLPYAVSRYIEQTNDYAILEEVIPYLRSNDLSEEELERYEETVVSDTSGTLLDHCFRAINRSLKFGEHGLPLMGIGDWNDGMSRIGAKGRGESVWLGWFIIDILKRFTRLGNNVVPTDVLERFEASIRQLEKTMNEHAWDGSWFRRAFTDAGTWIGSTMSQECKIDAIAQSWSVISGATTGDRQLKAMTSFDRELVDRELGLARLLTKPFDVTKPSPGYIQGYPPGLRENGGQYTHGVIWSIVAWSLLGRRDKAFDLFSLINPINHTLTAKDIKVYGNEPYAMSADVYTAYPHQGRGGWSWYTGASSWMYQAGLEYVLGVKLLHDRLYINPCVPVEWSSYRINYLYGKTSYTIEVFTNESSGEHDQMTWILDSKDLGEKSFLTLVDDGITHHVQVYVTALKPVSVN